LLRWVQQDSALALDLPEPDAHAISPVGSAAFRECPCLSSDDLDTAAIPRTRGSDGTCV